VLTHMSPDMLARDRGCEVAEDGLELEI